MPWQKEESDFHKIADDRANDFSTNSLLRAIADKTQKFVWHGFYRCSSIVQFYFVNSLVTMHYRENTDGL